MENINLDKYKLYEINMYFDKHFRFEFLCSDKSHELEELLEQFTSFYYRQKNSPNNMKEFFYKYLTYNAINYIEVKKEYISLG